MALLYIGAVSWLIGLWRTFPQRGRANRVTHPLGVAEPMVRFLRAVVLIVFVVLLALARSAGRSHYRW
jgi:hypothetical protein